MANDTSMGRPPASDNHKHGFSLQGRLSRAQGEHREGTGKGNRHGTERAQGMHGEGTGRAQGRGTRKGTVHHLQWQHTVPRCTGNAGTWKQGQMGSANTITQIPQKEREGAQ